MPTGAHLGGGVETEDFRVPGLIRRAPEDGAWAEGDEEGSFSNPRIEPFGPPDDGDELEYKEVAHCDGCKKEIKGVIHKCIECFDFDLCRKCYPKLSKEHHNGEHKFATEKAQKEMS